MFDTDINYLAVFLAAAAAWVLGAVWYTALSKRWQAAAERTPEAVKATGRPPWLPFILSFLLEVVMAYVLARIIAATGPGGLAHGLTAGLAVAVGFAVPATVVNYAYPARRWALSLIDGGHWLLVLLAQGAVIGAMG